MLCFEQEKVDSSRWEITHEFHFEGRIDDVMEKVAIESVQDSVGEFPGKWELLQNDHQVLSQRMVLEQVLHFLDHGIYNN